MGETMKILIGYDGSECADAALEDLQRAGLGSDAEAFVMTVADVFVPMPINEKVENTVPMYIPPAVKRAHELAQHKLEEGTDLAKQVSEQISSIFPTWRISSGAEADSPMGAHQKSRSLETRSHRHGSSWSLRFWRAADSRQYLTTGSLRGALLRSHRACFRDKS